MLGVLKLVLNHAMGNGQLHANPAQGVRVLRSSRIDYRVAVSAKADVKALIDAACGRLRAMLIVSAVCGLRASETRGLRWYDIDFAGGFLHIRQRADFHGTIGEPKSAAGFRSVPAGPYVLAGLREWKLACPKSELDLVFPATDGSVADHSNMLCRHFKPLCATAGVSMRWHDLRHFAVSLWIEQNFSIKEVMSFAGHASVQMTMERYGHLFPTPDHQCRMAQVEQHLFG